MPNPALSSGPDGNSFRKAWGKLDKKQRRSVREALGARGAGEVAHRLDTMKVHTANGIEALLREWESEGSVRRNRESYEPPEKMQPEIDGEKVTLTGRFGLDVSPRRDNPNERGTLNGAA